MTTWEPDGWNFDDSGVKLHVYISGMGGVALALPYKKAKPSSKYKVTCTTMQQQYRGYILLKH